MNRWAIAVGIVAIGAAGCGSSSNSTTPTTPSNAPTIFTVNLSPSQETPPVTNAEASGKGTAVITINTVKDGSGNVTSATADFNVSMSGFPNGTTAILAHIHPGALGVAGGVLVNTTLSAGTAIAMPNGSGTFSFTGIGINASDVANILANPQNFYFNVHTTLNPNGVMRGQLK
jgi:hypothetical protein